MGTPSGAGRVLMTLDVGIAVNGGTAPSLKCVSVRARLAAKLRRRTKTVGLTLEQIADMAGARPERRLRRWRLAEPSPLRWGNRERNFLESGAGGLKIKCMHHKRYKASLKNSVEKHPELGGRLGDPTRGQRDHVW